EFARIMLQENRHPAWPICPRQEPAAQDAERHWRAVLLAAMEKFLKQGGLDPEELAQAPLPSDDTCRSYCPRCLAQYTNSQGACADCGGLPLVAFSCPPAESKHALCK